MLDSALQFVVDELNSYLKASTGLTDDVVKLGAVVDDAGKYALAKESIVLTLINIEQETVTKQQLPHTTYAGGKSISHAPELRLNLFIMFAARFSMYDQALKYLSLTMKFFQRQAVFSPDRNPALDPSLRKIALDLQSPNYDQLNQIWAFIGGKHLPSVYYKIRVISLSDNEAPSIGPPVLVVNSDIHGK